MITRMTLFSLALIVVACSGESTTDERNFSVTLPSNMPFIPTQDGQILDAEISGNGFRFSGDNRRPLHLEFANGQVVVVKSTSIVVDEHEYPIPAGGRAVLMNVEGNVTLQSQ